MQNKDHYFRFKQFSIDHSRASMKVGTDAVLLGAWTDVADAKRILDIGTGSGVIALMLAQRSNSTALIDAVEIEKEDVGQAIENVAGSPWPDKVRIHPGAIQAIDFNYRFDLIVSNPPFFVDSLKPPDQRRAQSRHAASLSHSELIESVLRLLSDKGRLNLILPANEAIGFINLSSLNGLYCSRQWVFRSRKDKPVERYLLEFRKVIAIPERGEIVMFTDERHWTEDFKTLTKEFFLKL